MTGNGRGTMRPQGRSPPFLLIGLLVVICILGFSYWNVSSKSNERASQITILKDEVRMLSTRKLEAEKRSESTSSRLSELERERTSLQTRVLEAEKTLEESKTSLKNKEDELQSAKNELDTKKETLSKCEQDSSGIQQELQKLKEEAEILKQDAANKPAQCDQTACEEPIKRIMSILVKALGRQQIISTLQSNSIDTDKIIPADAGIQQPQVNPVNTQLQLGANANQQQPAVNPAQKPADPQQPVANPVDKGGVGQVQPPQNQGQQNVVNTVKNESSSNATTHVPAVEPARKDSNSSMHEKGDREVPFNKGGGDDKPGEDKNTEGDKKTDDNSKVEGEAKSESDNDLKSKDEMSDLKQDDNSINTTKAETKDDEIAEKDEKATGTKDEDKADGNAGEEDLNKVGRSPYINGIPVNMNPSSKQYSNQLPAVQLKNPLPSNSLFNSPHQTPIRTPNKVFNGGVVSLPAVPTSSPKPGVHDGHVKINDRQAELGNGHTETTGRPGENDERMMTNENNDKRLEIGDRIPENDKRFVASKVLGFETTFKPTEMGDFSKHDLEVDHFRGPGVEDTNMERTDYDFDGHDHEGTKDQDESYDMAGQRGQAVHEHSLDHLHREIQNAGNPRNDDFGLDADTVNKDDVEDKEEEIDEEKDKELKFEPNNLPPHLDVAHNNDAIDRMNANMVLEDQNRKQP